MKAEVAGYFSIKITIACVTSAFPLNCTKSYKNLWKQLTLNAVKPNLDTALRISSTSNVYMGFFNCICEALYFLSVQKLFFLKPFIFLQPRVLDVFELTDAYKGMFGCDSGGLLNN